MGFTIERVPIDDALRADVRRHAERARALRLQVERPPVTENERLCPRCSLAPVCLPEEERLAQDAEHRPLRLFPPHSDRMVLHVIEHGAHIGRKGDQLAVRLRDADKDTMYPVRQVESVVVHGYAQISTQALRLCVDHEVTVQWMTPSGMVLGAMAPVAQSAQRQLRQFAALSDPALRLRLARALVAAKVEAQLQFLLRGTRGEERTAEMEGVLRMPSGVEHIGVPGSVGTRPS